MMTEILMNLKKVIFNVFQDMLFLFPEEYDEDIVFPSNWIKCKIKLLKKDDIGLNFYFTPNTSKIMTENYLGLTDDLNDDILKETIKETTNVVAGNFLNTYLTDYNLGIPQIEECEKIEFLQEKYKKEKGFLLDLEGEPFLLLID